MPAPCFNCEERHLGCHIDCEKYISYRRDRDNELERRRQERASSPDSFIIEQMLRQKKKH